MAEVYAVTDANRSAVLAVFRAIYGPAAGGDLVQSLENHLAANGWAATMAFLRRSDASWTDARLSALWEALQ